MGRYIKNNLIMEDFKKKSTTDSDKEIVFSKTVKAGKRIYYFDVKKNRKEELFLAITESKKVVTGEGDGAQVTFEKHKIFLYKEDFKKFIDGLHQTINYIEAEQGATEADKGLAYEAEAKDNLDDTDEIKLDIDF